MSSYEREARLQEWDTKHFGVRIASFGPQRQSDVPPALESARRERIDLMMARCDTANSGCIHDLERAGFLLMDTFVRYAFPVEKRKIPDGGGKAPIRPFNPHDEPAIEAVARRSFQGYAGHFHNDPRLPREKCDALYSEWAANSCRDRNLADDILVADEGGKILGFTTLKKIAQGTAEAILFGIDPEAQRMGVGRSLMIHGLRWCEKQGFWRMEVGSQVKNYAVQRVWQRLGFEIHASGHTFHRWFTE